MAFTPPVGIRRLLIRLNSRAGREIRGCRQALDLAKPGSGGEWRHGGARCCRRQSAGEARRRRRAAAARCPLPAFRFPWMIRLPGSAALLACFPGVQGLICTAHLKITGIFDPVAPCSWEQSSGPVAPAHGRLASCSSRPAPASSRRRCRRRSSSSSLLASVFCSWRCSAQGPAVLLADMHLFFFNETGGVKPLLIIY